MSDAWFAIVDATGECRSLGTRVADPLPAGLEAVALSPSDAEAILTGAATWSPQSRAVVALPPPVPASVTRWQARRWLVDHGYDLGAIEAQFETIADSLARARALVDWRDAPVYERTHPLVEWLGTIHGLDAAGLDQAFREMGEVS
jgi:hypothetical protein